MPIHFDGHKALIPIYQDMHPDLCILKGAQVGATYQAICKAFYIAGKMKRDSIYYLPDQDFARIFLKTRVDPVLQNSPNLKKEFKSTKYQGLLETDSGKFCYFKGLRSKTSAISVPSHVNIYDEVDVMPKENLEWSEDRLAASELGWKMYLSVGMIPGAGIDKRFQESDQHVWIVKCSGCKKDHVLEEEFPDCIQESSDGSVKLICKDCGKELDRQAGLWVAKKPNIETRGYRISQLCIARISLKKIYKRYVRVKDKPSEFAKFKCSALALPDAGNMQPVNDEVLAGCRSAGGGIDHLQHSAKFSYAGIDIGDMCHLVLIDVLSNGLERVIYLESFPSEHLLEKYKWAHDAFHIEYGVGDAMPYKTEMKKISACYPETFLLRYYSADPEIVEGQEIAKDGSIIKIVKVERNLALDELTDLMQDYKIKFPTARIGERNAIKEFDDHLKMLVKVQKVDARGNKKNEYRKDVDNHYGMALANARIAMKVALANGSYLGLEPVFVDLYQT